MKKERNGILDKLLQEVASMQEVAAIGQTGDVTEIPKPGESDIDIFVYVSAMPTPQERRKVYQKSGEGLQELELGVCEGGNWGVGDAMRIHGVETMLMYFTTEETVQNLEEILSGKLLDRVGDYYPIGRCAAILNMHVHYDGAQFLSALQRRLTQYPEQLAKTLAAYHGALTNDEEDFGRALRRKDPLFYHFAFEIALDHFLQAVFALNRTFFPSRKRTQQYLAGFSYKPERCYERMLEAVRLGGDPECLEESYALWRGLAKELDALIEAHMGN